MGFSEEQVRDAVSIKEGIMGRISRRQSEIEMLEKNLAILDEVIRGSSFSRASQLGTAEGAGRSDAGARDGGTPIRGEGGALIANAYVTPESVSIVMDGAVHVREEVPPFKSFFLDRIIGGIRAKDGEGIECTISKRGPDIAEITIRNYGGKERADELVSSAGWSLKRMLEKAGG